MILHVESKNNEAEASSGESSSCLRVFASLAKAKTVSSGFRSSLASLAGDLRILHSRQFVGLVEERKLLLS